MSRPTYLIIKRFQDRAESLKEQFSGSGLDDAIASLAGWMDAAHNRLTDQDRAVLTELGGVLYREGLHRKN
ncbi:hypothetical protein ACFPPF_16170 [Xenophilus aerolatus]|nr:hypothetical protein [Xenophilus aerolatus]